MFRKLLLFFMLLPVSLLSFGQQIYDFPARALVLPEFPQVGDMVSVEGIIVLPHPGYSVDHIDHAYDESTNEITVNLHIYLNEEGIYPQVEVDRNFRYVFQSPAEYRTGIQEFVTLKQVAVETPILIEPLQDSVYESLSLNVFPQPVLAGRAFMVSVSGTYPTTGYQLRSSSLRVDGNTIVADFEVIPSLNKALIPTPFTEALRVPALLDGTYDLQVVINGKTGLTDTVTVAPRQSEPVKFNPFGARFNIAPEANPEAPHEVYVTGEFSTGGWTLQLVDTQKVDEFISFEIEAIPPDGPAVTVITPFNELIATLDLGVGFHYFRGTINGHVIPPVRIYVGEVPPPRYFEEEFITLKRTGGIAGENSWITIDREGNYARMVSFVGNQEETSGTLPTQTLDSFVRELNAVGLELYPVVIKANANVADVFEYSLIYDDAAVKIEYLDTAPEELQEIVREIEAVLNDPMQTSAVDKWEIYN